MRKRTERDGAQAVFFLFFFGRADEIRMIREIDAGSRRRGGLRVADWLK